MTFKSGVPEASLVKTQWWRITCQCKSDGFPPWPGKIPHTAEQLSPWTAATQSVLWSLEAATPEPTCYNYWESPLCLEPGLGNKRSHCNEKPRHHNWRPSTPKNKLKWCPSPTIFTNPLSFQMPTWVKNHRRYLPLTLIDVSWSLRGKNRKGGRWNRQ